LISCTKKNLSTMTNQGGNMPWKMKNMPNDHKLYQMALHYTKGP
jgi:hypothetical protein